MPCRIFEWNCKQLKAEFKNGDIVKMTSDL